MDTEGKTLYFEFLCINYYFLFAKKIIIIYFKKNLVMKITKTNIKKTNCLNSIAYHLTKKLFKNEQHTSSGVVSTL